jgi:hypothetical protein
MDLPLSREAYPSTYIGSWRVFSCRFLMLVSYFEIYNFPLVLLVNYSILIYPLGV